MASTREQQPQEQASRETTLTGTASLELAEFDARPRDPIELLREWLALARGHGVREPNALALATADDAGRASSRIVLLKTLDTGLVFTSHHGSRKGRELDRTPWAAGTLYWRETLQQVNVAGPVERLSEAESDALFDERPRDARATAVVSRQSEPLDSEAELRAAAQHLSAGGDALARPQGWGGFRLVPQRIEFWHGSPDRLHRRLQYLREGSDWRSERLQP